MTSFPVSEQFKKGKIKGEVKGHDNKHKELICDTQYWKIFDQKHLL